MNKLLLLLALFLSTSLSAQVTIGSAELGQIGSLLDIKNITGVTDGSRNATGGLGLPRVGLTNLKPINGTELAKSIGATGAWDVDEHAGLVIYNVGAVNPNAVCARKTIPGMYVWTGTEWQGLGTKSRVELGEKPINMLPVTALTGLNEPNSYLVTESSVLRIPIDKAKKVWDGISWTGDTQAGVATLLPVLPTARTLGRLKPELVWSTDPCDLILNAEYLEIVNEGGKEYIEVWVGDAKGNAVVALKDGENIVWSWHIWATNSPGTNSFNNLVWMDRNLGATSATVNDPATIGLHYQWGRKDPFPTSDKWDMNSTSLTKIYMADGSRTAINTKLLSLVDNEDNLKLTINSPHSVIISTGVGSTDWYSPTYSLWNDRWSANPLSSKSVSDPCPEGWRVPNGTGITVYPWNQTTSPWDGLNNTNFVDEKEGTYFRGKSHANAGYYPAAGYRFNNGVIGLIAQVGNYWTASPGSHLAKNLNFESNDLYPWSQNYSRIYSFAVRCVQE